MNFESFFFGFFAILTVVSALMVILTRNALSCAFFLILSLINSAGLYVLLQAHFVAVAQVLVYAGAIVVLFIFVIMLLNLPTEKFNWLDRERNQVPGLLLAILSFAGFAAILLPPDLDSRANISSLAPNFGTVASVGLLMFTKYFVAFEIVAVLLLAATIGAVLLAKKEI